VHADRGIDLRKGLSQVHGLPAGSQVDPRVEDSDHASVEGSLDDLWTIFIETIEVKVAMCVYQQRYSSCAPPTTG
jgi:hypothetical protein